MGDLIIKKGKKKESTAPVLIIGGAEVKILSAEFLGLGDEVVKKDNTTFTVEKPHIACELELVDAPKHKKGDIGTTWYEKFYYLETEKGSGEYELRPGTKIGGLAEARYGEDFWETDKVLKAEDLVGFTFLCNLKPKNKFGTTEVTGTCIDHESIEAIPEPDWD
jgi:hypothetical protein